MCRLLRGASCRLVRRVRGGVWGIVHGRRALHRFYSHRYGDANQYADNTEPNEHATPNSWGRRLLPVRRLLRGASERHMRRLCRGVRGVLRRWILHHTDAHSDQHPNGNAYSDANEYTEFDTDADAHSDGDANDDGDSDANIHTDRHGHNHPNGNADGHRDQYADSDAHANRHEHAHVGQHTHRDARCHHHPHTDADRAANVHPEAVRRRLQRRRHRDRRRDPHHGEHRPREHAGHCVRSRGRQRRWPDHGG